MSDKDYRRDWAQTAALNKLRELKEEGRAKAWIARQLDVSPQFIDSILREEDPKPVSKKVFDGMIEKGWITRLGEAEVAQPQSTETTGIQPDLSAKVRELYEAHERILARVERLMDRYEAVVVERDALKAERDTLRAQLAKAAQN